MSEGERESHPVTVLAAMAANLVIMVAKFVAAAFSGSAAMFAEGVHSAVDTANQGIILFGVRRSKKPADEEHPFGYGKEVYFWALIYAVLLFGIGGGVSIYEGLSRLLSGRGEVPESYLWSYVVLGVALVAEGSSWLIAVRAVEREETGDGFLQKLFRSKDPSRFIVVGEDTAALAGVLIAAAGLGLSQLTGSPSPDAIASVLIGLILGAAALYLVAQSRRLLVGESTDPEVIEAIEGVTSRRDDVVEAGRPFTLHFGPERILVALDVTFRRELSADQLALAVDEIEADIRSCDARVRRIFIEAQRIPDDIEQPASPTPTAGTMRSPSGEQTG